MGTTAYEPLQVGDIVRIFASLQQNPFPYLVLSIKESPMGPICRLQIDAAGGTRQYLETSLELVERPAPKA